METGKINVQTENIFPIIKKFLYSDHEIFLRELVSNAVDATKKLKGLSQLGEVKGEIGDTTIQVKLDKENKTLTISDKGIGMTADEVKKYINQIAFSSAGEFVEKLKNTDSKNIIGHFGLGFYSAFMVAEKVEIQTKSYKDEAAAKWICDGSTDYTLETVEKQERGTDIILHIAEDSLEFLEEQRIKSLLNKYCKFLPIPIQFGYKWQSEEDKKAEKPLEPEIINNTEPAWVKSPSSLNDEDYKNFYRQLYPMNFDEPLFWIHLNVDYPFNLTGILYFPKLKKNFEVQKDKIQLYSNQVFVTDNVGEIVPEYLTLLHGVIDSPDIPLNVSRSYLQSDGNVKKINQHISKKVSDKLQEIFKADRKQFEEKWSDIGLFVKYGMISDEKFYERSNSFALFQTTENTFYTYAELKEKVTANQTDKDGNLVILYTSDSEEQHSYIKQAKDYGYEVVQLDTMIDNHFIQQLEMKNEKTHFKRVDADILSNLISKDENVESALSKEQEDALKVLFENTVEKAKVDIELKALSPNDAPIVITRNEFMRRMQEMQKMGGGSPFMFGGMDEKINLVINTNHSINHKLLEETGEQQEKHLKQLYDLALLSQNMLKGEALTNFVNRSFELI
ncbi:MAG TPA: molecular chaperone HtpG [Chitinophagales bacterium]|nr:molecular chaperone HtpG [Chitinophagales bacterium]MCB9075558.1 molecular chaperone HtpG [Chitinophagales bacterium]HMU99004.1 molecular chaperone HtpG [Chitinophagales bacterium]HMV01909.1 molecular chaperone HtpG [Chitinophagales bacterium]HMW93847.1 molecular chaperone HtpG [Chitinophagales bacterium]